MIAANELDGIGIYGPHSDGNIVAGNYIGMDATGTFVLGNGQDGIWVAGDLAGTIIGTDGSGPANSLAGNLIAFNGRNGVTVGLGRFAPNPTATNPLGTSIRGNRIYSNARLGIDLSVTDDPADGVTANDPGDVDTGPNRMQNFPVLTHAAPGAATRVAGGLHGEPGATYAIDFYASAAADPSGHGEGERHLGSITVTTDAAGNADFDTVLPSASTGGEFITTTTTDANGNTSEFSAAVMAMIPVTIDVKPDSDTNTVNLASQGMIAAVIFTTDDFDASWVDVSTVRFAGAWAVHGVLEDVDGDGELDLLLHFRLQDTNLAAIYEQLLIDDLDADGTLDSNRQVVTTSLTGETLTDEVFAGYDELDLFLSGKKLRDLLDGLFS